MAAELMAFDEDGPGRVARQDAPGYVYDVFVSYPHEEQHRLWVHEFFLKGFRNFLRNELGREPRFYVDTEENDPGDAWPSRLMAALGHSRIVIPIWSVEYFNSNWCRAECAVMLYREKQLGLRSKLRPEGLILPVRLFDGSHYPKFARDIQSLDCTEYNIIYEYYKNTPQYFELQKLLRDSFAKKVAARITGAPPWSADWLASEWLDDSVKQWVEDPDFKFPEKNFNAPSLT